MNSTCLFCSLPPQRVIAKNSLAFATYDGFPVTPLHSLVIPMRHVETFFDLSTAEVLACNELLHDLRADLLSKDSTIAGFNIGMNAGKVAGQTIFHCHIHLIPRRQGDVENPQGCVRHLIPVKGFYQASH